MSALALNNVEVMYSNVILAVKGVNITVPEHSCTAMLGANGAGKSTVLKAISGSIASEDGSVTRGSITLFGEQIGRVGTEKLVGRGLVLVAEGRRVLPHMTVEQNLIVGGHVCRSTAIMRRNLQSIYDRFPRLYQLRQRLAGHLSGGEQQILVISRALMAEPKIMLIDEPSLGLAPLMVKNIYAMLAQLKAEGLTLLIVEQNAKVALDVADHCYVMEEGRIVLEGSSTDLAQNKDVREFYLGLDISGGRKSFRDIKHYRRRKRWLG
ncbi:MAG: ABC transporter ATP-binding protein [Bradyrhizobium sp.]